MALKWLGGGKPDHPLADDKGAKEVLSALPPNDPAKAIQDIRDLIESVLGTVGFKDERRGEVIMLLDEAAQAHQRKLARDYLSNARLPKFQEGRMWGALFGLWKDLASAYAACLTQFALDPGSVGKLVGLSVEGGSGACSVGMARRCSRLPQQQASVGIRTFAKESFAVTLGGREQQDALLLNDGRALKEEALICQREGAFDKRASPTLAFEGHSYQWAGRHRRGPIAAGPVSRLARAARSLQRARPVSVAGQCVTGVAASGGRVAAGTGGNGGGRRLQSARAVGRPWHGPGDDGPAVAARRVSAFLSGGRRRRQRSMAQQRHQ